MGCDIHYLVEVREGSRWSPTSRQPVIYRNYHLFADLAGVRQRDPMGHPIARPRGVPEDASQSFLVMLDKVGSDAHTPTWLTLSELRRAAWHDWSGGERLAAEVADVALGHAEADVRLVFFFDN